ncbi:MAG: glycosyl transferase family 2, partial [Acidobacteria bacterium]|nr:glycosyl transferase family 2 [Acidobacteriota bacterium]
MAEASLLPDEFVQQLMAVGQVDVLVGIPTLDNAATIAEIIKVVHRGFATYFPRDRTVLINSDGGSKDETRSIVRDLSLDDTDTLTVTHGLRTTHRISTPYHGVPGKGSALRQIFAAADLLQARAVAVLDPDVTTVTPEWIGALLTPVRQQAFDFVAPIYTRHPLEGPLVTQLIRPLMRAAYGWQVAEPQAAEFGCSGRFASHCLDEAVWDTSLAQYGIDIWTT